MTPLSDRTRHLLDAAREQATPTTETLQRVRARVVTNASTTQSDTIIPLAITTAAKVGLAGVVVFGLWYGAQRLSFNAAPPLTSAAPAALTCPSVPACPAVAECPTAPTCSPVVAVMNSSVRNAREPELRRPELTHPGKQSQSIFSVPGAEADRWALELGLLKDARTALDEGRVFDAMGYVERHRALFPKTTFEEERLAIEVLSRCANDQLEPAAARLKALRELDPETTYLPRIRTSCAALFENERRGVDEE